MTVIAFRPRSARGEAEYAGRHLSVTGTFQSPRGRSGQMHGILRVQRCNPAPGGARVQGVFTAELREADGSVIGVDSRRTTVVADAVPDDRGLLLVVAPLELDLMGMTVHVQGFTIEPDQVFPSPERRTVGSGRRSSAQDGDR